MFHGESWANEFRYVPKPTLPSGARGLVYCVLVPMRIACALAALRACGRVGFDATCASDGDCGPCQRCDDARCTSETIGAVSLGHRSTCFLGRNGTRWCVGEFVGVAGASTTYPARIPSEDSWQSLVL